MNIDNFKTNANNFIDILTIETGNSKIKEELDLELKKLDKCDFHDHYLDHHHDLITETQHYHIAKKDIPKAEEIMHKISIRYRTEEILLTLQLASDNYLTPLYVKLYNGEHTEQSEIRPI